MSAKDLKELRESFFKTVFSLLGRMANCDGYINRNEIKRTQTYIDRMHLSPECQRQAIQLFRKGASPQFDTESVVDEFRQTAQRTPSIIEVLLIYLITLARVDGLLVEKEIEVVRGVAKGLGYSSIIFDHLLRTIAAEEKFAEQKEENAESPGAQSQSSQSQSSKSKGSNSDGSSSQHSRQQGSTKQDSAQQQDANKGREENHFTANKFSNDREKLKAAYEVIGVPVHTHEAEVKKAYRKLVSRFHPDKLQGQGLPPELMKSATERFKKIQGAYDYIKQFLAMT